MVSKSSITTYSNQESYVTGFAGGWPSVFYVCGLLCVALFAIVVPLTSSRPETSRLISAVELAKIRDSKNCENMQRTQIKHKVPWGSLLTSKPVWAYVISRTSHGLLVFASGSKMPAYMGEVLHLHSTHYGMILSLLSVVSMISHIISGIAAEKMIGRGWITRTNARKLFSSLATLGRLCTVFIPVVGCNVPLFIMILVFERIMDGTDTAGNTPVPSEMSRHFPSTIFAMANALVNIFGIVAPYYVGVILESHWSEDIFTLWEYVYWSSAALAALGSVVFVIYGDATRQPWDIMESEEDGNNNKDVSCADNEIETSFDAAK